MISLASSPLLMNSTILKARVWPWFFHACACEPGVIRSLSKPGGRDGCRPWFYRRLKAYGFLRSCEGA